MNNDPQDLNPPLIPPAVLSYLEGIFPDQLSRDLTISDRALGAAVGEQRVLDHLRQLVDEQISREME